MWSRTRMSVTYAGRFLVMCFTKAEISADTADTADTAYTRLALLERTLLQLYKFYSFIVLPLGAPLEALFGTFITYCIIACLHQPFCDDANYYRHGRVQSIDYIVLPNCPISSDHMSAIANG